MIITRSSEKKRGRRKAQTWGRTHGPSRGNSKRIANKGVRKEAKHGLQREDDDCCRNPEYPE
jgi:hypothetical protein